MQLATEVGFAPPVLVKSTIYASEDPVIKNLRGSILRSAENSKNAVHVWNHFSCLITYRS